MGKGDMIQTTMKQGRISAICLLLLSAVIGGGWPAHAVATEIKENVAIQALPGEISALDPPYMLSTEDTALGFHVYETLTRWDPDSKAIVPVLATSWTSNEAGTEWTFILRQGVKFHDGTAMTARDVKASLDRNIKIGMVAYDFIGVESIEVVDDYTVRFKTSAPRDVPLIVSAQYGMFIYAASAVDQPKEWWAEGHDAGTGPYTIASFEPGTRAVLNYYPDYWGGWEEGQFTKIAYAIVEDPTVRDQMIRSGDADMTSDLPFDALESLKSIEGLKVEPFLPLSQLIFGLDNTNAPLDNADVRRALAMTFPYEAVHNGLYLGQGRISVASGPTALWTPPSDFPQYKLDLDQAAALLKKAGHADGFELRLAAYTGSKEVSEAIRLWQSELSKVNVKLTIRELASGAFWDAAYNPENKDYDVFVVAASGDVPSPYAWLIVYTDSGYSWLPAITYKNPEFDKLVFEAWALEATDKKAANDVWVKAQRVLHDDAASIFAMDAPVIFAYKQNITGFKPNPPYSDIVFWYQMKRAQ
jgi:peptide/nickel transport system substrate-binding protein